MDTRMRGYAKSDFPELLSESSAQKRTQFANDTQPQRPKLRPRQQQASAVQGIVRKNLKFQTFTRQKEQ